MYRLYLPRHLSIKPFKLFGFFSESKMGHVDVFISHRGRDVKTSFVSHLYRAFQTVGVCAFLDCNDIEKGSSSWEVIEDALAKAHVVVIVFSKGFAGSCWCLKELTLALKLGKNILPIFYNVQAQHVRRPNAGPLQEGYNKLKSRSKPEDVNEWSNALEEASWIHGWEFEDGTIRYPGNSGPCAEAELIEYVVDRVRSLISHVAEPYEVGKYMVGLQSLRKSVMGKLLGNGSGVITMGICGLGGIGKTTLAMEVYNKVHRQFDKACYIKDVRGIVAQSNGRENLQQKLLKLLFGDMNTEIDCVARGKTLLKPRLSQNKLLIVLDDVDSASVMDDLQISKDLGDGSRCIIISRDKRVLEEATVDWIKVVQPLCQGDGELLFCQHAFGGSKRPHKGFEVISRYIVEACCGLPLLLEIIGAHLKQPDDRHDLWNEVLGRLKTHKLKDYPDFSSMFKLTYDHLMEDHQQMFLDAATILFGAPINVAKRVWRALGYQVVRGFQCLVGKGLVVLDNENLISMPGIIKEAAQELIMMEREDLQTRMWIPNSLSFLKKCKAPNYQLRHLSLTGGGIMPPQHPNLCELKGLQMLSLGRSRGIKDVIFPKSLLYIKWQQVFEPERIPWTMLLLSKLVILDLSTSHFEYLWDEPADDTIKLEMLEVLDLSSCRALKELPRGLGGKLPNLRRLNLKFCKNLVDIPPSAMEMKNLHELDIRGCQSMATLPVVLEGIWSDQADMYRQSPLEYTTWRQQIYLTLYKVRNEDLWGNSMWDLKSAYLVDSDLTHLLVSEITYNSGKELSRTSCIYNESKKAVLLYREPQQANEQHGQRDSKSLTISLGQVRDVTISSSIRVPLARERMPEYKGSTLNPRNEKLMFTRTHVRSRPPSDNMNSPQSRSKMDAIGMYSTEASFRLMQSSKQFQMTETVAGMSTIQSLPEVLPSSDEAVLESHEVLSSNALGDEFTNTDIFDCDN